MFRDRHSLEILKGTAAALAVKVLGAGVGFLLHVALARMLGASLAGLYFLALAIVTMAATIGRLGMDAALVQYVSAYSAKADWSMVKAIYVAAGLVVLLSGALLSSLLFFGSGWFSDKFFASTELKEPLAIMAVAILPTMLFSAQASALQGLKQIAEAGATLSLFAPALTLLMVLAIVPAWGVNAASASYLFGALGATILGIFLWRLRTPELRDAQRIGLPIGFWARVGSFFGISVLQQLLLWSSTFFVGRFCQPTDIAIFSVSNRTAMLTLFILVAVNTIGGPKFSELNDASDLTNLRRVARRAMALAVLAGGPICAVLVLFNSEVMSIFGPDFVQGGDVLAVIATGIFFAVGLGPVSQLLLMCGGDRALRYQLLFSVFVNLATNITLTPKYGAIGAAISTAASFGSQALASAWIAQRQFALFSWR